MAGLPDARIERRLAERPNNQVINANTYSYVRRGGTEDVKRMNPTSAGGDIRQGGSESPQIADSCATQSHNLVDASLQGQVQNWIAQDIRQTSAGRYDGCCNVLSLDGMHIVHEHQNQAVYKTGITPKNICTVSLAFNSDPALRFSQFSNTLDSWLFFLPEEHEFDIKLPGDMEILYVCLEQDSLMAGARILNERYWERPPAELQIFNTGWRNQVAGHLMSLLRHFSRANTPPPLATITDAILLAMNNATEVLTSDVSEYKARRRYHQLVKNAREFIDAHLQVGKIPGVVDICAYTGVSQRTLQYAFLSELQLSPLAYIRIVRLNRVRAQLLGASPSETTVTNVATAWGFFHLGKFSQDYRRMFGELPSASLAHACG
ncbi:MAG: helix-turn-helix domain-containing protein [Chromatiales bacterium]